MSNTRKVTFGLSVAILVAIVAAIPFAIPAIALHRAKSAAWRMYDKLPLDVRQDMNATPTLIELPHANADPQTLETAPLGGYMFRFPHTESRTDKPSLVLVYPRFEVAIVEPEPLAAPDAHARSLGFRDSCDLVSAANHTRLDDLDRQPDLPSIQRHAQLIEQKMTTLPLAACFEEFDRKDIKGFIMAADSNLERIATQVFVPASHIHFTAIFEGRNGFTLNDVRQFLAQLHVEPAPPPDSAPATTLEK